MSRLFFTGPIALSVMLGADENSWAQVRQPLPNGTYKEADFQQHLPAAAYQEAFGSPLPPPPLQQHVLTVPADAWHAMQQQLSQLMTETSETKRFLRAHLRLEHDRRLRAATRLQSAWRRHRAATLHPLGARFTRWRRARRTRLLLNTARLHVSRPALASERIVAQAFSRRPPHQLVGSTRWQQPPAVLAGSLLAVQACARGFLVRLRAATWRAQRAGAISLQRVSRGRQSRRRHALAFCVAQRAARLEARVLELQKELGRERRAREVHELALRKLWTAVFAPPAAGAAPAAVDAAVADGVDRLLLVPRDERSSRIRSCERVCAAAAKRRAAAERMQAAWRARRPRRGLAAARRAQALSSAVLPLESPTVERL